MMSALPIHNALVQLRFNRFPVSLCYAVFYCELKEYIGLNMFTVSHLQTH